MRPTRGVIILKRLTFLYPWPLVVVVVVVVVVVEIRFDSIRDVVTPGFVVDID